MSKIEIELKALDARYASKLAELKALPVGTDHLPLLLELQAIARERTAHLTISGVR